MNNELKNMVRMFYLIYIQVPLTGNHSKLKNKNE